MVMQELLALSILLILNNIETAADENTVNRHKREAVTHYWNPWGPWTQENADTWSRSRTCSKPGMCTGNAIQRRRKSVQETTTVENVEETGDMWLPWGQWTHDSKTSEVRKRECKVAGKCTGNSVQKRGKSSTLAEEDAELFAKDEFPDDWNQWSAWTLGVDGWWNRERTCKNALSSGKCRGVSSQSKKSSGSVEEVEVLEDWEQWSTWTEETAGFWIRKRNCKNPSVPSKCRGSTLQRKMKKIVYQYQMEVDMNEVLVDWEVWGAWVDEPSGDGYRERVCKNKGPNAKCRGKAIQRRKRIIKDTPDDDKDATITNEHWEDWEQWGAWTLGSDGWWVRERKCKNQLSSGNCRGISSQKRKLSTSETGDGQWNTWSEWAKESEGVWTRKRTCTIVGKCRGTSLQRRTTKITYIYIIECDAYEVAEDWEMWSEWVTESETVATRKRVCKNAGPNANCRGKEVQKRIKQIKEGTEPEYVVEEEVPEGWDQWTEWAEESKGVFVRRRKCVNKAGKCVGNDVETKITKVTEEYEIDIDSNEVLEDWNTWGEWVDQPDGSSKRVRLCKITGQNAKCRGKSVQIRRRIKIAEGIDDESDTFPDDWNTWSAWSPQPDNWWVRSRTCKNPQASGKCRGPKTQRRRLVVSDEVEVPEDWESWTEWIKESEGVWTRKRTCTNKEADGKCRGSSLQRKTKKILYVYIIECDENEVIEDWETWGEWVSESETVATRTIVCKNKGPNAKCRGKRIQKRIREVKPDPDPEYVIEEEVPEDWGLWTDWTQESSDTFVRSRTCLNKPGKCRGSPVQKKKIIIIDEYEIDEDTSEVLEDWDTWGEWVDQPDGSRKRVRVCKNKGPDAKCRGKAVQIRRRIKKPETVDEEEVDEFPEDWNQWGEWTPEANNWWVRKRTCKNPITSGKCRGTTTQKRTVKTETTEEEETEVLTDWFEWSSWEVETDGYWIRRRKCKNDGVTGLCRGKPIEKSKTKPVDTANAPINGAWSLWSPWSPLTGATNPEKVTRTRTCTNPAPSNGGKSCKGINEDSKLLYKPIDGNWGQWSPWSEADTATTVVFRTRECNSPVPLYNGKTCFGPDKEVKDVVEPTDGNWGPWTPWSFRTGLTNPETIKRIRVCNNPLPSNGGKECVGDAEQTDVVYNPIDGEWTEWSSWSTPIEGTNKIKRTRKCTNPKPEYGGKQCVGPAEEVVDAVLPTNGNWGPWGAWSELTGKINPETRYRKRTCDNPSPANGGSYCAGMDTDEETVYKPIDGAWGEWSPWSDPTEDSNTVSRTRKCDTPKPAYGGQDCVGSSTETKDIIKPVDGNWGEWSSWSESTHQSNPETLTRKRHCDNPTPANGGKRCTGKDTEEKEFYTPVQGGFTEWSQWEVLTTGKKKRTRTCTNPTPKFGGANCIGAEEEVVDVAVPVDGNWGPWTAWSQPTGLTNPETLTRTRSCDNPSPANGGSKCDGSDTDTLVIKKPIEGNWSPWTEWTVTKDGENVERRRECNNPKPIFGGEDCKGSQYESAPKVKSVDGKWGEWQPWSPITGATNPETIKRKRVCDNPRPAGSGKTCLGTDTEEQVVYKPINGNWGEWYPWTDDVTGGTKTRRRDCNNPSPQYNGKECVGENKQTVDVIKPTNGEWGDWSPWSEPTKTSNPETLTRTRLCNSPPPANNGLTCKGIDQESKVIYHPINGNWGEWTPWSAPTVGSTTVARVRTCDSPAPQYDGLQCIGSSLETKDVVIPTNGNWGPWSPFTEPTWKTNPETIERKRFCDSPSPANGGLPCEGIDVESKLVYRPIDGKWSEWAVWSQPTPDSNQVKRTRKCDNPAPLYNGKACVGPSDEVKDVIKPTDGKWGPWSEWSQPKYLTNPEKVVRQRFCNDPTPANNGKYCESDDRETKEVFTPVDGKWGPWSDWGDIEEDAKILRRFRKCDSPAPQYGGNNCTGFDIETKPVDKPVAGKWGEWSPWSKPTGVSNPEVVTRTRTCDNPTPANGGKPCEGSFIENKVITTPIDGGWSPWSEWSLPQGLTNPENVTKTRTCSQPAPAYDGKPCQGIDSEVQEVTRPIDGSWGAWSPWSRASGSKNKDKYTRTRKCDNPTPKYGGKICPGIAKETKVTPYPEHGNWGKWGAWSEPTWKTNPDTVVRIRICNNPPPKNGGRCCVGPNTDTKNVTKQVDGSWGDWSSWSVPEGMEPPVNATRTRKCSDPAPQFGGADCVGPDTDAKLINKPTPVDGGWNEWTPWSVAPGKESFETVDRTRKCSNPEPLFGGKKCDGPEKEFKNVTKPVDGKWGEWEPWSKPTGKSNPETLTRIRKCDSPEPLYGGATCFGSETDTKAYTTPLNGQWTEWSEWSKPTGLSNPETLTRTRSCTKPAPAFGGESCKGEPVETKAYVIPVDGQWSPWTEWSKPSGLTQPETLKRTRLCNSPSPSNGGKICDGPNSETKEYYTPINGNWGPWSDWSTPTGTADMEVITRKRSCNSPAPQYDGKICEGADTENTTYIKETPKPVDGNWGEWSPWTKPTGLVNPETLSRARVCDNPTPAFGGAPCTGKSTETKVYYNPVDGRWGEWSTWSLVADSDTKEIKSRFRECDSPAPAYGGKDCAGDADEAIEIIKENPKPIDGNWTPWSEWSIVPSSENPTNKTRFRTCGNPSPQMGGADCKGDKTEIQLFYKPIDGQWGTWSEWTEKITVGNIVTLVRQRQCDKPEPKYEGKYCQGSKEETTEIVKEFHTPVDGQWGPWTEWSKPLKLSNPETVSRSRVCDNPTSAFGGKSCPGMATELKDVFNPIDGNWGEWTKWSEPTGLVNPEIIKRTRKCDSPAAEYGGTPCHGDSFETKEVFTPVNGGWGEWSPWSNVPGNTTMKRTRNCDKPYPAYGGKSCEGSNEEIAIVVIEVPQPINGNWGSWTIWTTFTKTDKIETFARSRECDNPTPNFGGSGCEGPSTESRSVNLPVDGNWSPWSEWSTPTGVTQVEIVKRTRKCSSPSPNYGGKYCVGYPEESKTVNKDVPAPIDGGWTEWSDWLPDPKVVKSFKRTRSCTNPIAQNGGIDCTGPSTEKQTKITCPPHFKYIPETGKCYKLIKKRVTWEGARQTCKKLSPKTHLVTIDGQSEQIGIQRYFSSINSTLSKACSDPQQKFLYVWTAAKRLANQPGAKFVWLPYNDREPQEIIYSSWKGNAPNLKPTSGEQCTFFDLPNFRWVDGPCGCAKVGQDEGLEIEDLDEYEYEYEDDYEDEEYEEYEILEDHTEELEEWGPWAEWTKDDTGYWVRDRKCKMNSKPCVGRNKEKRKYLKKEEQKKEVDLTEVLEDWGEWSPWTEQENELVRRRKCKNSRKSGLCRGKNIEKKEYSKKNYDYEYEYEYEDEDYEEEVVEEQWGPWLEWSPEKNGESLRIRNCLRKDKPCVGKNIQKRKIIKKKVKVTDEDSDEFDSTEVDSTDWGIWSEWTQDADLYWVRRRICKKGDGKCYGRRVQCKKYLVKKEGVSDSVDSTEILEDWESWSEWTLDENSYWIRKRICKKVKTGGKCTGRSVQRKKHLKLKWQKIEEGQEDVDSTEEPEGWDVWSPWAKDSKGYLVRKRTCKKGPGKCKGRNGQRKKIKIITKEKEIIKEDPKDWDTWSTWTEDGTGYWIRTRNCKRTDGKCGGKKAQRKRLITKSEDDDETWSIELVPDSVPEVLEDWNEWGEWIQGADGWMVRKRICKNPGGKCRGRDKQRKRRRTWRVEEQFAYTLDGSKDAGPENPADWNQWGEWELIGENLYIRRRICKNAKGPCRGRKVQKRRKIAKEKGSYSEVWDVETISGVNVDADWYSWTSWIWNDDQGWFRERSCRNSPTSRKCRGPSRQKRKIKLDWITKIKDEEEELEDEYSLELSDDKGAYIESDEWDKWGPWEQTSEYRFQRKRKCKKPDGKCKGKAVQKRRERTWKLEGSWAIDESIDTALEVAEDWGTWSTWTQTGKDLWTRTRNCKNNGTGAHCRGSRKQTKRKKTSTIWKWIKKQEQGVTEEWAIDISFDQVLNFQEDWEQWGDWTLESDGSDLRNRVCKAGTQCRGKNKQRRIRKVKTIYQHEIEEFEQPDVEEWSIDISPDDLTFEPNDWDQWGEWTTNLVQGEITRERKCLKPDGNCKGKKVQIKVRRHWKQVGEFIVDTGLKPGDVEVDDDWNKWSAWTWIKANHWVRTRQCKDLGGKCRGSEKQTKKKGRKWTKRVVAIDPSSWSVDIQGDGNTPEVLEDWELWGTWTEGKNHTLRRVRFCRNKIFGGQCRGNSEEWRRQRRWKYVGDWSYEVSQSDEKEVKEDWLTWGEWALDTDVTWVRTRKCKNGNSGQCRGNNKERRRKRKVTQFDFEAFKKFIFGDKSPPNLPSSSWKKYFLEKIKGADSETAKYWFQMLIKWQEDKASDWKKFKIEHTSDEDLLDKFKRGFIKFTHETSIEESTEGTTDEDYGYEYETVIVTKTAGGEIINKTYKDNELPEEWKKLIERSNGSKAGEWKNGTFKKGSMTWSSSNWTSTEYTDEDEGDDVEWTTFTVGDDGQIQNYEDIKGSFKTGRRKKRSVDKRAKRTKRYASEGVDVYDDPTCGINMCALCEMELQ